MLFNEGLTPEQLDALRRELEKKLGLEQPTEDDITTWIARGVDYLPVYGKSLFETLSEQLPKYDALMHHQRKGEIDGSE